MKHFDLCIYHADCIAGFTAAYAVWEYAEGLRPDNPTVFRAANYGDAPPDVTDKNVIIVDFSYNREVLLDMARRAKRIVILDHHDTAEQELVDLPGNVEAHFDMDRSGAMMAYEYFSPRNQPSHLFRLVEDRDLWRFKFLYTKAFYEWLTLQKRTFEQWRDINHMCWDVDTFLDWIRQGELLLEKHRRTVETLVDLAYNAHLAEYEVPFVNAPPMYASDIGHVLASPESVPFAVIYWDDALYRHYSLRSAKHGAHVGAIASQFGGGGHPHAAGFRSPRTCKHPVHPDKE